MYMQDQRANNQNGITEQSPPFLSLCNGDSQRRGQLVHQCRKQGTRPLTCRILDAPTTASGASNRQTLKGTTGVCGANFVAAAGSGAL